MFHLVNDEVVDIRPADDRVEDGVVTLKHIIAGLETVDPLVLKYELEEVVILLQGLKDGETVWVN